ncbi:uncharacterized protein LOC143887272 isoform X2 [Tasmannia lanceolata]|uniref:uncharacterized protein LOC143887272 isoform X2 n=1 Tax=Tasmannia lanceolata TaxID=3420 RepID=UPI0040647FA9
MGQKLGRFWGRVQGKQHVQKICDKIFNQCVEQNGRELLRLNDLHLAILLVYNAVNKHFNGPHKEPPSVEEVRAMIELLLTKENVEGIDREQFYQLILKSISKDLNQLLINKFVLALLVAPAFAEITKIRGLKVLVIILSKRDEKEYKDSRCI